VKYTVFLVAFLLALPCLAYDYPLSANDIRDAYFLGQREGSLSKDFRAHYSQFIKELHQRNCTSEVRVETPFFQVAESLSSVPNFSSQDAVKMFYEKPLIFRLHLNLCYMTEAPPPGSVKIRVKQNKKELVPDSDTRKAYAEPFEDSILPPNGEQVLLEFDAQKVDSSTLTLEIGTPNEHPVEVELELSSIR
jgi:hypothetical protein